MMKRSLHILPLLLSFIILWGQGLAQNNVFSGLQNQKKLADRKYEQQAYLSALNLYEKLLAKDSSDASVQLKMAEIYKLLNRPDESEKMYRRVINNPDFNSLSHKLSFAQVLLCNKKYEESKKWFNSYNSEVGEKGIAGNKIEGIEHLEKFFEDSLNYRIREAEINSSFSDFCPVFYKDGLVFSSSRQNGFLIKKLDERNHMPFLKLYFSRFENNNLCRPVKFSVPHHLLNAGPVAFCDNGNKMIITGNRNSGINSEKEVNRLMLFSAEKEESTWGKAESLPFNNPTYSCGHPAITKDGQTLYFVSDMPGGYGGTDIYKSTLNGNSWSDPLNLGSEINTAGNEMFPYLHENQFLYFASDGYAGLGGLDIYRYNLMKEGNPSNLGYPVNSSRDDFSIVFDESGKAGFFSSNRNGEDNIYRIDLIQIPVGGEAITTLKEKPLQDVRVTAYYENDEVFTCKTRSDGSFSMPLQPGKKHQLIAEKDKYRNVEMEFTVPISESDEPLNLKLEFEKQYKSLVKGVVKTQKGEPLPAVKVFFRDKKTSDIDSTITDVKGEFFCEIDLEQEHLFWTESSSKFGKVILRQPEEKKYSVLYYVNIEMQNMTSNILEGHVTRGEEPAEGAKIIVEEQVTGKTDTIYTDTEGKFSFKAFSYGAYKVSASCDPANPEMVEFTLDNYSQERLYFRLDETE